MALLGQPAPGLGLQHAMAVFFSHKGRLNDSLAGMNSSNLDEEENDTPYAAGMIGLS